MKRNGLVVALAACALLASCKGMKVVTDDSGTRVEGTPVAAASEDRHWIQSDEVFVIQYDGQESLPCFEVAIARMVESPSEATKGQAKVFELRAGKERWSSNWWNSRPAQRACCSKSHLSRPSSFCSARKRARSSPGCCPSARRFLS